METIGDAYMVVSGLPIRNDKEHPKEIALLALDIMENIRSFTIQANQKRLAIRIGIHCGTLCFHDFINKPKQILFYLKS